MCATSSARQRNARVCSLSSIHPEVFGAMGGVGEGVYANSLAAISEVLNGYWLHGSTDGGGVPLRRNADLTKAGGAKSLPGSGPNYPFLVGLRNSSGNSFANAVELFRARFGPGDNHDRSQLSGKSVLRLRDHELATERPRHDRICIARKWRRACVREQCRRRRASRHWCFSRSGDKSPQHRARFLRGLCRSAHRQRCCSLRSTGSRSFR